MVVSASLGGRELSMGAGEDSIGGVRTPVCAKIIGKLAGIDGRRDPAIARLGRLGPLKLNRGVAGIDGRLERGGRFDVTGPRRFCVVAIVSSVVAPSSGAAFSSP